MVTKTVTREFYIFNRDTLQLNDLIIAPVFTDYNLSFLYAFPESGCIHLIPINKSGEGQLHGRQHSVI